MARKSNKPAPLVTKESLQRLINDAEAIEDPAERQRRLSAIVGRALVRIFEYQTKGEQHANTTDEDNGVGFAGADAKGGCLTAKSYLKNRMLQDWQLQRWVRRSNNGFSRICKYAGQLNRIALLAAEAAVKEQATGNPEQLQLKGD